ncbi:MAG: hypothetical protein AAFQ85_02325 [Pseudomonadota bacterium]
MFAAHELSALWSRLEAAGLSVTPERRLWAMVVFTELTDALARKALPRTDAADLLGDHLRPVIAQDRDRSARFDEVYQTWSDTATWLGEPAPEPQTKAAQLHTEQPAGGTSAGSRDNTTQTGQEDARTDKTRHMITGAFRSPLAVVISALIIGAGVFAAWSSLSDRRAPDVVETTAPIEDAAAAREQTLPSPAPVEPTVPEQTRTLSLSVAEQQVRDALEDVFAAHFDAPTLRELHRGGVFADVDLSAIAERVGLPLDHPLALDDNELNRLYYVGVAATMDAEHLYIPGGLETAFAQNQRPVLKVSEDYAKKAVGWAQSRTPLHNVLRGHSGSLTAADYHPGRDQVLTVSQDGTARIWDAESGDLISEFAKRDGSLESAVFSPDGTRIVATGVDEIAQLWDSETGETLAELIGHTNWIVAVAFSPDGTSIVTASYDGTARIWDSVSGTELAVLESQSDWVLAAAFSPDGTRIVTTGRDGSIRFWNTTSLALADFAGRHDAPIAAVDFHPDRDVIVTGDARGTASIWDVQSGRRVLDLTGHYAAVTSVAFSPDGAHVLATSEDSTARIWNVATGEVASVLQGHGDSVRRGAFNADGTRIVTAGDDAIARIWDASALSGTAQTRLTPQVAARSEDTAKALRERLSETLGTSFFRLADGASYWNWAVDDHRGRIEKLEDAMDAAQVTGEGPRVQALRDDLARLTGGGTALSLEDVSDDALLRFAAATSFRENRAFDLQDPPWSQDGAPVADASVMERAAERGPELAAAVVALTGGLAWLWSAIGLKGFLQRRRPGEPGRIIELFSDARKRMEAAQRAMRAAASALLSREDGAEKLDLTASIRASAKAGGLFTPVTRPRSRLPDYLFLIDSRARVDHGARRALDYLDRLHQEHVPFTRYFFERAPDRVRPDIGAPSRPLADILGEHSGKRLVIVGDAADLLEPGRMAVGRWGDLLQSWRDRALLTTVPESEWGAQEQAVASLAGLAIAPLSADGLTKLPETFEASEGPSSRRLIGEGGLSARPLPSILRERASQLILEDRPREEIVRKVETSLLLYLGLDGWRWLCACAVYPVVEWELTVALGLWLKDAEGDPIFTEKRAAELSELPWMRAGDMPDWLRALLIERIDDADAQSVRAFLADVLESVDRDRPTALQSISLRFSHADGRAPESDERFVDFVTRRADSANKADLAASRTLRRILKPSYLRRLYDRNSLAWLAGGLCLSLFAWLVTPRSPTPSPRLHDWAPLIVLLGLPAITIAARKPIRWFADWIAARRRARLDQPPAAKDPITLGTRIQTSTQRLSGVFGVLGPVRRFVSHGGPAEKRLSRAQDVAAMLRIRLITWVIASISATGFAVVWAFVSPRRAELQWSDTLVLTSPLSALRGSLIGETVLTLLLAAVSMALLFALAQAFKLLMSQVQRIADLAGQPHPLTRLRYRFGLTGWLGVAGLLLAGAAAASLYDVLTALPAIGASLYGAILLVLLLLATSWHAFTLRRYARWLAEARLGLDDEAGDVSGSDVGDVAQASRKAAA